MVGRAAEGVGVCESNSRTSRRSLGRKSTHLTQAGGEKRLCVRVRDRMRVRVRVRERERVCVCVRVRVRVRVRTRMRVRVRTRACVYGSLCLRERTEKQGKTCSHHRIPG